MGSKRRLAVRVVGFAVLGAACLAVYLATRPPGDGAAAAARDGSRVFCLSPEQRTRLTEAADNLAVTIPPEGFRDGTGPEFDRVCAALVTAARLPQQGAGAAEGSDRSAVDVLLPVVAGAALTWSTGFWRDERTQSRLLADALRTASRRYQSAARAQREKWFQRRQGQLPVDQAVLDGRDELAAQLRKVAIYRPGWTAPASLHDRLSDPRLGEAMNEPREQETPRQRDQVLRALLDDLRDSVDDVVSALERPWRWHGEMRRRPSPGTEVTSR